MPGYFRNCRLRFVVFFVERGNGELRHWVNHDGLPVAQEAL